MNQPEREHRVLEAARNLIRIADKHRQSPQAFSEFISTTSQLPIARLEHWERAFRSELWLEQQPGYRFGFQVFSSRPARIRVPWLYCCSGDGYQREQALIALGKERGAPNGFLLAMVLRRLNDWVPEVRAAARRYIPSVAVCTESTQVLEALWGILPYLHTWERWQSRDREVIANLLEMNDIPLQLSKKLIAATTGPAPSILGQVGQQPAFDRFLLEISEQAVQPAVRAKAYKSQLEEQVTWLEGYRWTWTDQRWCQGKQKPITGSRKICVNRPFLETLTQAAKDKSPMVRRVAGDQLIAKLSRLGAKGKAIAETLSQDGSPSVAERGLFALKRIDT